MSALSGSWPSEDDLYKLREQAAIYAAGETPLHLLNQIEAEEMEIRRIEEQLRGLEREGN